MNSDKNPIYTFYIVPEWGEDFITTTSGPGSNGAFSATAAVQDSGSTFPTITAALKALDQLPSGPAELLIRPGVYQEQVQILRPDLTLTGLGKNPEDTILTGGLYAKMPCADIGKLGTFRSFSCRIAADDVTVRNLTFENSAGMGVDVGQALALYADGDRLVFDHCRFLGGQDTLFTAPLPPAEIETNGFFGPGRDLPRRRERQFYKDCYLEGDIDFVFGGATAWFENCEFFSKNTGQRICSYVTAASTPEDQTYGYVMNRCRFTGNCPPHSAYLGRPWREYAKTVLLNCHIGEHICEAGWHDWGKTAAHETVFFAEYCSSGPSSDIKKRPGWVRFLTPAEASCYTIQQVLGGRDHWNP